MIEPLRGGITWPRFIAGALGLGAVYVLLLVFAVSKLSLDEISAALILAGAFYVLGAVGRPRIHFLVLRNAGWFRTVEADASIQAWLFIIGVALAFAGGLWAMVQQ